MYEPIQTSSARTAMAAGAHDYPHRSREEELDIQLAAHLAALLAVTDELRALAPSADLDAAAAQLTDQLIRVQEEGTPARPVFTSLPGHGLATLHCRAHTLAGRALVVAASRADTTAAILAAERMDAHAEALEPRELPPAKATSTGVPPPAGFQRGARPRHEQPPYS
ncbi:SCO4983 family protein [Streptomyces tendae]|uniref:SCO4983 family protein n=1 Tax=Streptomyces tendae TaxID=1932 RepID=UPI00365C5197